MSKGKATEPWALPARFWAKVRYTHGGCWVWTACKNEHGYGQLSSEKGKPPGKAHRLSLAAALGRELIPGEFALHSCDVPACVNPQHLRVGTQADNMRDASERGRNTRGESSNLAKLRGSQVLEIRRLLRQGVAQHVVADLFGVTSGCIWAIKNRRSWAHLPEGGNL